MQTLAAYQAFLAVLDSGSISAASRSLGLPRPTLSRRLAQLERGLGVRLLHLSTRRMVPTREGTALAKRLRPILRDVEELEARIQRQDDRPRGLLRVSVSPLATGLLRPMFLAYRAECPGVVLQIQSTNRFVDLKAEQVDVALRGGVLRDPNLVARVLLRSRAVAVATPELLANDHPTSLTDLERYPCLLAKADAAGTDTWPLRDGGTLRVRGHLVTNDRGLLKAAAREGQGIALMSTLTVQRELLSGALVPVLPELIGTEIGLYVLYAERAYLPLRVRVFIDRLVSFFATQDDLGLAFLEERKEPR